MTANGEIFYDEESAVNANTRFNPFTRENAIQAFVGLANNKNYWEQRRINYSEDNAPLFIRRSKMRAIK